MGNLNWIARTRFRLKRCDCNKTQIFQTNFKLQMSIYLTIHEFTKLFWEANPHTVAYSISIRCYFIIKCEHSIFWLLLSIIIIQREVSRTKHHTRTNTKLVRQNSHSLKSKLKNDDFKIFIIKDTWKQRK